MDGQIRTSTSRRFWSTCPCAYFLAGHRIVDMETLPGAIFIYLRNGTGMEFQQQLI
ncbi:MAG: hypothetical protein R2838_06980 [Caldilineaceae bacterium]